MLKRVLLAGVCPIFLLLNSCKRVEDPKPVKIKTQAIGAPLYHADGEVLQLLKSTASKPFNIVITGDGFMKDDITPSGELDKRANEIINRIFSIAPFNTYKQYFNVYMVYALSNATGIGNGTPNNTKFGVYLNDKGSLIIKNPVLYNQYILKATGALPNINVLLLNNTVLTGAGGSTIMISTGGNYLNMFMHLVGHHFGLGDEYENAAYAATTNWKAMPNYPNLDLTNDPLKVKWAKYLQRKEYNASVNIFEGGYFVSKGVYRPEYNSVMRDVTKSTTYNAPSREAIARQITDVIGNEFDITDFLKKDKAAIPIQ